MAVATGSYKRGERSEKGEAGKDMERDEGYPTYVQYHAGFSRGPAKFPELVGSDKISLSAGLALLRYNVGRLGGMQKR
jgi:hypothetical protein